MDHSFHMISEREIENRKKAATYTAVIVALLLLICFVIKFKPVPPIQPVAQDLIEINLGNYDEGDGQVQPLIKGDMVKADEVPVNTPPNPSPATAAPAAPVETDDKADEDAAPVAKVEKPVRKPTETPKESTTKPSKPIPPTTNTVPTPKPPKPKYTYPGAGKGTGNGADQDNGYTSQGNKPGGRGDAGDPSGKPDSYGNTPGGRRGGPQVIGNRKIIKYYSFTGELEKAVIYANVKVSPSGTGTFLGFGKGSTTRGQEYANAIANYLRNVQFDAQPNESTVTVVFNFNVN